MSIEAMKKVYDYDLPPREKFVLLMYADHANSEGEGIFPKDSTIAKLTGYSRKTVFITKTVLQRAGLLIWVGKRHFKNSNYKVVEWQANLDWTGTRAQVVEMAKQVNAEFEERSNRKAARLQNPSVTTAPQVSVTTAPQVSVTTAPHDPPSDPPTNPPLLEFPKNGNPKGEQCEKELTPRQEAIKTLEDRFSLISRLQKPKRTTDKQRKAAAARWWVPLGEIYDLCGKDVQKACTLIDLSYAKMIKGRLEVSAPQSILEVCRSLNAKQDLAASPPPVPSASVARRTVYRAGSMVEVAAV